MNVNENIEDGVITVSVEGEIDGSNVGEFEEALKTASSNASSVGATTMIVDLKELEYVSSAGLRVFLLIRKLTESAGQKMIIRNVTDDVMDIFSVTGFVKLLTIEE